MNHRRVPGRLLGLFVIAGLLLASRAPRFKSGLILPLREAGVTLNEADSWKIAPGKQRAFIHPIQLRHHTSHPDV